MAKSKPEPHPVALENVARTWAAMLKQRHPDLRIIITLDGRVICEA